MRDLDAIFSRLSQSRFRSRFSLDPKDRSYLDRKGLETILSHARDFVEKRLSAPNPTSDGKQTPWRGHPVFVAQHATGTCCRSCLMKWHGIPKGQALSVGDQSYIVEAIARWLISEGR